MKGKVLIIEDDKDWQNNLQTFLEVAGFYVEVVDKLEKAELLIQKDIFHFITIDMQLDESNLDSEKFEGWDILSVIKRLRINDITPTMVITGFEEKYLSLKKEKKLDAVFFMGKGTFDRKQFIEIVERSVKRVDLRFKDDHRSDNS